MSKAVTNLSTERIAYLKKVKIKKTAAWILRLALCILGDCCQLKVH
jgi:hypothetical protein